MASKTGYDTFGEQKPKEMKIHLPMVADSTVEVAVDIDTGLDAGDKLGWTMVGADYCFRFVASPHQFTYPGVSAADDQGVVQLVRGASPDTPVTLDPADGDVIYDMGWHCTFNTGVGFEVDKDPWFRKRKPERTQMSDLHLVFGTYTDNVPLSDPAVELFMVLYYYLVTAPEKSGHEE